MGRFRTWVLPVVVASFAVAEGAELDPGPIDDAGPVIVQTDGGATSADGGVVQASWARVMVGSSVVVDTMPSVNLDVVIGRPFVATFARRGEEADGVALVPGLEGAVGGIAGERCNGVTLCGLRLSGGLAVDAGFFSGLEGPDGRHAISSFHAFGVALLVARSFVEAAPLAPSTSWTELLVRARLSSEITPRGATLRYRASLLVDIPIGLLGTGPREVRIGAGIGFSL